MNVINHTTDLLAETGLFLIEIFDVDYRLESRLVRQKAVQEVYKKRLGFLTAEDVFEAEVNEWIDILCYNSVSFCEYSVKIRHLQIMISHYGYNGYV